MTNHGNRQRWAINQKKRARSAFIAGLPSVEDANAARLTELRKLADMLEGDPNMASTLNAVQAEIARLY